MHSGNASIEAQRHRNMRHDSSAGNNGSAFKSHDPGPGNTDGPSFIGLSLSCDGRDWAPLIKVAPTTGRLGRTDDQVSAISIFSTQVPPNLIVEYALRAPSRGASPVHCQPVDGLYLRSGKVNFMLHRDVYDISPHAKRQSRLVRRELDSAALQNYAAEQRPKLLGCQD
jgi:hypothetical protein